MIWFTSDLHLGHRAVINFQDRPFGTVEEMNEAIYIGQSLHLANRVKQHLQGNGNKNVYHDYQNGKQIYIHLERCMPSYMNRMEKDLIRSFKATRSYNIQKGGGKHRRNKDNFKYK